MIRNFCHLSTILLVLTILITPAIPMFNFAQDSIKIGQTETDAEKGASPADVESLQRAGELHEKSNEYAKAVDQYMVIHEKYPGTDGALAGFEKCATLYEKRLKMRDKAVEVLNFIVEEFPDSKNAKKAEKRLQKLKD